MRIIILMILLVSHAKAADYTKELRCLKDIILYEANGEPEKGKIAVAYVVKQRVKSKHFKDTYCGVSYERNQFEFHKYKHKMKRTRKDIKKAYRIARLVLAGKVGNPVKDAYFFKTKRYHKGRRPIKRIGSHYFAGL